MTPGSSPLSRGIPSLGIAVGAMFRIIPALAGNTAPEARPRKWWWDHPRSRGEYIASANQDKKERGSSPLSRGILE